MDEKQLYPAIELRNVTKRFGSTYANSHINMTVYHGEILSLLGENGSGKTTLVNMLSGIYYPDEGEIFINGEKADIKSPKDAFGYGIGMVHQHFKLIDVFTAAENVALGLDSSYKYDIKAISKKITEICERYGFSIDPNQKVYNMSVSQKQTLEIIKVLYRGAEILILDEPTAVLTPQETDKLFNIIKRMREDGKSIIIITHKLAEVLDVSDRVYIMRKGTYVGTVETESANEELLTEMMVGEHVSLNIDRPEPVDPQLRLDVQHLSVKDAEGVTVLDDVTFKAYGGEVLGIAGIAGSGQKELLEAIAGLKVTGAESSIIYHSPEGDEKQLIGKNPKTIKQYGISLSFVPEDRLGMGLVGSMGMVENMMLRSYDDKKSIFVHKKNPTELAKKVKKNFSVVTPNINMPIRRLSGGNVQKVLVGREIESAPSVLMTAYAVRGLDINTSYVIYDLINTQKKKGVAVIYVGEDLDVLLALSDKVMVLCGGKVTGIVDARTTTKEEVGRLMTGSKEEENG